MGYVVNDLKKIGAISENEAFSHTFGTFELIQQTEKTCSRDGYQVQASSSVIHRLQLARTRYPS